MTGTLLNVAAIAVGALLGVVLGGRLPVRVRSTVTDVLGLFVLVLGIASALETFGDDLATALGQAAVLVVLGALLFGAIVGESLDLERRLTVAAERLRDQLLGPEEPLVVEPSGPDRDVIEDTHAAHDPRHRFVEGFVVTTLVVCVGPLAILGPLQEGLSGDYQLLAVKAVLDGFAALAFASALGVGVAFAAVPLLLYQGTISLGAASIERFVTDPMLAAITALGGFLVVGIGLRLLEIRQVRVANLLPGLLLAPLAVALWP